MPAGIVVAQVDDRRLLAGLLTFDQSLGRPPHLALARVAPAGEVGHVQLGADAFDHANQGILFNPALDVILLRVPQVHGELIGAGPDDGSRAGPVRAAPQVPRAVFNRVPVDQARQPAVVHHVAQRLVALDRVRDQVAADELVVKLPQGQLESLGLVLGDDLVGLVDACLGIRPKRLRNVADQRHGCCLTGVNSRISTFSLGTHAVSGISWMIGWPLQALHGRSL